VSILTQLLCKYFFLSYKQSSGLVSQTYLGVTKVNRLAVRCALISLYLFIQTAELSTVQNTVFHLIFTVFLLQNS